MHQTLFSSRSSSKIEKVSVSLYDGLRYGRSQAERVEKGMNQNLFGSYKLVRYGYDDKKTHEFKPISEWYSGEIHYFDNGHMSVIVRFAEKPEDFTDFVAYAGTFSVENNELHHEVTESARPEYLGQKLKRRFKLENNTLYTEFENTEDFIKYALWKKF